MAALTNTLLIIIPSFLASFKAFRATKEMGGHLQEGARFAARFSFAGSAGCTIFFFGFYFCLTVGIPVDLDFIFPGIKGFPWLLTPAALLTSAWWYNKLKKNTLTFGERE